MPTICPTQLDTSYPITSHPLHSRLVASNPDNVSISQTSMPLRSATWVTKPPSYLNDFQCHLISSPDLTPSKPLYPISNYLSYTLLSPSYKHFVMTISSHFEPQYYHQAIAFPHWREAMKSELDAMESNNTWSIFPYLLINIPLAVNGCIKSSSIQMGLLIVTSPGWLPKGTHNKKVLTFLRLFPL